MDDFEQWMQQQFPEGEADPAEETTLTGDLMELLEGHNLPHQAVLSIFELVMPIFRAMARIDNLAKRLEAEGITRPGFRQALEALVVRHITIATKDVT
jgi:hypothetical protein